MSDHELVYLGAGRGVVERTAVIANWTNETWFVAEAACIRNRNPAILQEYATYQETLGAIKQRLLEAGASEPAPFTMPEFICGREVGVSPAEAYLRNDKKGEVYALFRNALRVTPGHEIMVSVTPEEIRTINNSWQAMSYYLAAPWLTNEEETSLH